MSESIAVLQEGEVAPAPQPAASAHPLQLAWRALLLEEHAYAALLAHTRPLQRGFVTLLWVLGILLLARLIGFGFNWLTTPRLEGIEALLREFVTDLPWYAQQVRQSPGFAAQFAQNYFLTWEGLRALLGIQTPVSVGLWAGVTVLDTLLAWLIYGTLAHWSARWLDGSGRWSQTLGATSLAYAPLLLTAVEMIPGAALPLPLLFLLMLVGKYQALKCVHGLTPGYTLAAVLLPYLLASLLLLAAILFGAALGLEQLPFFDQGIVAVRVVLDSWRWR